MILTRGEKLFGVLNTLFFLFVSLIIMIPVGFVLKESFDVGSQGDYNVSLIPKEFSLFYYRVITRDRGIYRPFLNSIFVTLVGTALAMGLNSMGAYTLSKRDLPGNRFLTYMIIGTMVFSGGLVPLYLVVMNLGLIDKLATLVIISCVNGWYMILMKSFYQSIPRSLPESARIDGAGEFLTFRRIIFPLSAPVLAAIALFTGVTYWNTLMYAVIFMNSPMNYTFPVKLREMISVQQGMEAQFEAMMQQMGSDDIRRNLTLKGLSSAVIIVSTIPVVIVYPYLQKHFVKGILIGSIKG